MQRRAFWLESDPAENRQFRRCWTMPPPPMRKRRPAGTGTANFKSSITTAIDTAAPTKLQARALAEALFRRAGAA